MKLKSGHFRLEQDAGITWSGGTAAAIMAEELASALRPATGFELATADGTDGDIRLIIEAGTEWKNEEYRLTVRRMSVTLSAGTSEGLFRGIQTVRQLLPPQIFGEVAAEDMKWTMPCVSVTDYPRFGWRGMHLDVSRHFFGVAAARSGHKAVMAPVSHCYFNVYQGDPATEPESFRGLLTLKKVYSFEPVPPELSAEEAKLIIGAQGYLWTEYVTEGTTAEYMILPRLTALSEVVWTPAEKRDWEGYNRRLPKMMARFDAAGINYSRGSYNVDMSASWDEASGNIILEMTSEQPSPEIRYTMDGTDPGSGNRAWLLCDEIVID